MYYKWGNDSDPEENNHHEKQITVQLEAAFFESTPGQNCSASWLPYSLVKNINKHRILSPNKLLVT